MKKLLVIAILLCAQNIKADALSDAIRKSDVAAVKDLLSLNCYSAKKIEHYKELAQETIHLRREAVVVQDLRPRAASNNTVSNRYFNASLGAIGISSLLVTGLPIIPNYFCGKCPDIKFGDLYKETSALFDAYWEKRFKVLNICGGIGLLGMCIGGYLLVKSIKEATIAIQNHYDDAVTIKELLNDYDGCVS